MPVSQINSASIENGGVAQVDLASGVAGTGPAFNAGTGNNKSAANATATEMAGYNAALFDTASCFNTTTGRFTPNVAGYYQISCNVDFGINGIGAASSISASIYRNNGLYWSGGLQTSGLCFASTGATTVVFMNGTTDFVSVYFFQNTGSTATGFLVRFAGVMVRAA